MKKNLMSIIILAFLLINLIMTAIMMFSIINTNNKTAKLVGDIASALSIETKSGEETDVGDVSVSIDDTDVYVITSGDNNKMTIQFATGADGKTHYFVGTVSLSMNKKDSGYKKYGSADDLAAKESLIKAEINSVINSYTMEQFKANQELVRDEILERIQNVYDSKFIFSVNFSDLLCQ